MLHYIFKVYNVSEGCKIFFNSSGSNILCAQKKPLWKIGMNVPCKTYAEKNFRNWDVPRKSINVATIRDTHHTRYV